MKKSLSLVLLFILGALFGIFVFPSFGVSLKGADKDDAQQVREGHYTFINPLLECEVGSVISTRKFVSFKKEVNVLIDNLKSQGKVTNVALYYRDLNNGPWFGINEREPFIPASLLKLPLSIAFYKAVENDSSFLTKKIVYNGSDINTDQYFKPSQGLENGKEYSLEELVEHALVYSDNNAALALSQVLGDQRLKAVYSDLNIDIPNSSSYTISVKDYASFLRILFNSSYLNKSNSEKILSILSRAQFDKGLKGKLPNDIVISHKFGEVIVSDGTKQLHDCGIVYDGKSPYLLCVMTRGSDFDSLNTSISEISRAIYDKVK